MAPQTSIPTSANVLGTIGTVLWCIQLVPQIVRNYRTKSTEGLPVKRGPQRWQERWLTTEAGNHDVPLVFMRSSLRRICHCTKLQYPDPGPAAMFLPVMSCQLGSMFEISTVSKVKSTCQISLSFAAKRSLHSSSIDLAVSSREMI